jgi:hypothetical protein
MMAKKKQEPVPVFMPALVVLLLRAEQSKGEPLTEDEVLAIRDGANCVMMPSAQAKKQEETRGYPDVDPENCWEDWQQMRLELAEAEAAEQ